MKLQLSIKLVGSSLLLMAFSDAHAQIDFLRSDFNESQPFHVGFLGTGSGTPSYTVANAGGNPGTWGRLGVRGSGFGGPDVIGYEYVTFDDWTVDPSTVGTITGIDAEGDARNYTFQNGFEQGAKLVFILNQAGNYYAESGDYGGGTPWFHGGNRTIPISHFVKINPLTGRIDGSGGTPNPTAGIITLGFGMDYTYPSDSDVFTGIDNVHYHINSVPEPTSWLAIGAGLAAFFWRRKPRLA